MRVAELSRRAGVPVPTIKYYLRENLLPPGEFTSPNQARYDERHVHRLRLIRALVEVGRLPIATIRQVLAEIDKPGQDAHGIVGRTLEAVAGTGEHGGNQDLTEANEQIAELIARHDWQVSRDNPAWRSLAEVITTVRQLGMAHLLTTIDEYADTAERVAAVDVKLVRDRGETDAMVYTAVVGTILGERIWAELRHLAHEDASARTLRRDGGGAE
jgi:DNA-binding transcriptional MerR regulator